MFADGGRLSDASKILNDAFRSVAVPVLKVCRVPRPELLTPESRSQNVHVTLETGGPENASSSVCTYICEGEALEKYAAMNEESFTSTLYTLLYILLQDQTTASHTIMQTLENILQTTFLSPIQERAETLTRLACFILSQSSSLSAVALELFVQWVVPLVVRKNFEALEALDQFDWRLEADRDSSKGGPNAESRKTSDDLSSLSLSIFLGCLSSCVVPGSYTKSNLQMLETMISIVLQTAPPAHTHRPVVIFLRKCPRLAASISLSAARWATAYSPENERALHLITAMLDDKTVLQHAFTLGGSEFPRALWDLKLALSGELPLIFDTLSEQVSQLTEDRYADPTVLKEALPSGARRWIDFLLLKPEPVEEVPTDIRARPFLENRATSLGLPESSLALKATAAYAPRHFDWLLAHRLSQKIEYVCPSFMSYLNLLAKSHVFRSTENFNGPESIQELLFMDNLAAPNLLSYVSPLSQSIQARFTNIMLWLISICGAGFRFPIGQAVPHDKALSPGDVDRLPTSFLFTVALSTSSMAMSRLAFFSDVTSFFELSPKLRKLVSHWTADPLNIAQTAADVLRQLPSDVLNNAMAAALIVGLQNSFASDIIFTPTEQILIESSAPYRRLLEQVNFPLASILDALSNPMRVTRFTDGFWSIAFLLTQAGTSILKCASVLLCLMFVSVSQLVSARADSVCHSLLGGAEKIFNDYSWDTSRDDVGSLTLAGRCLNVLTIDQPSDSSFQSGSVCQVFIALNERVRQLWDSWKETGMAEKFEEFEKHSSDADDVAAVQVNLAPVRLFHGGQMFASADEELGRFMNASRVAAPQHEHQAAPESKNETVRSSRGLSLLPQLLKPSTALPSGHAHGPRTRKLLAIGSAALNHFYTYGRSSAFLSSPWLTFDGMHQFWSLIADASQTELENWSVVLGELVSDFTESSLLCRKSPDMEAWPLDFWIVFLRDTPPSLSEASLHRAFTLVLMCNGGGGLAKLLDRWIVYYWLDRDQGGAKRARDGIDAGLMIRLLFAASETGSDARTLLTSTAARIREIHSSCVDVYCTVHPTRFILAQLQEKMSRLVANTDDELLLFMIGSVVGPPDCISTIQLRVGLFSQWLRDHSKSLANAPSTPAAEWLRALVEGNLDTDSPESVPSSLLPSLLETAVHPELLEDSKKGFEISSGHGSIFRSARAPQLLFLGAPGVGKGTFASMLSERWGIPHISTGDIIRAEISRETPLGSAFKQITHRGDLVPDDLVNSIVENRLDASDTQDGFILDGFPRTVYQAEHLDSFSGPFLAVNIYQPKEILVAKVAGRRVCLTCKKTYNLTQFDRDGYVFKPLLPDAKNLAACAGCGSLKQRADDREATILKRLEVYENETQPLIDYYTSQVRFRTVDQLGLLLQEKLEVFHVKRGVEDFSMFEQFLAAAGRRRALF